MKERRSARHEYQILPESLSKVTLSWGADTFVESDVVNFCTHGMKDIVPPSIPRSDIPKKNDTIKARLPINQRWLSGMCIYVTNELDGSFYMGIDYYVPIEQNYLNNLLSINLNIPLQEGSFVCHELEELADKLCN